MQGTETGAAASAEQLAHERTAVERCFTWSGLAPLPVFLLLHIGRELGLSFASDVSDVVRVTPGLLGVVSSAILVWAPLLLHAGLGAFFLASGRRLPLLPRDVPALSRTVSRATAFAALCFVAYHARAFPLAVLLGRAAAEDAGFRLMAQLSSTTAGVPLHGAAYLLGLAATSAHAGLAVHRGLLREGLLEQEKRRRISARLCAGFGALTFLLGAAAVIRVASGVLLR
jgi:hypothetical protein